MPILEAQHNAYHAGTAASTKFETAVEMARRLLFALPSRCLLRRNLVVVEDTRVMPPSCQTRILSGSRGLSQYSAIAIYCNMQ